MDRRESVMSKPLEGCSPRSSNGILSWMNDKYLPWNCMQDTECFKGNFLTFLYLKKKKKDNVLQIYLNSHSSTLHGHPHRSLVAQQQFSSSLAAKKLHNYSSSQTRVIKRDIAIFHKVWVWVNEEAGKPQVMHFPPAGTKQRGSVWMLAGWQRRPAGRGVVGLTASSRCTRVQQKFNKVSNWSWNRSS